VYSGCKAFIKKVTKSYVLSGLVVGISSFVLLCMAGCFVVNVIIPKYSSTPEFIENIEIIVILMFVSLFLFGSKTE
jgi:hypothetical protein